MKKLLTAFLLVGIAAFPLMGAENGENVFNMTWEQTVGENDHALWEVDNLPDLDGDGKDEILACSDENGITLFLFESTGDNSYEVKWSHTITDVVYSYTLSHGDLDRDGQGEIIVGANADSAQHAIWIFEWDGVEGSDNYELATSWEVMPGGGAGITALEVMDLDGDGVQEMFIAETAFDDFYVVQLDTTSDFTFPQWNVEMLDSLNNESDYSPWGFTAGDFDDDGNMEFASVEWDYNGLTVFQANGPNDYSRELWIDDMTFPNDGSTLRSLSSSDLDGDGYIEIILPSTNGRLYIFTNDGDMSAIDTSNYEGYLHRVFTGVNNGWSGGALGDADMFYGSIGEPDIYVAQDVSGNSKVIDFEYTGDDPTDSTSFSYSEVVATTDSNQVYQDVVQGDWDGDGQKELAIVSTSGVSIQIWEHEPVGGLDDWTMTAGYDSSEYAFQIRSVAAGSDLDEDGKPEVIFTDYRNSGQVHVFEVTGDNTLEWVFSTDTTGASSYVRSVITGDMDNDGLGEIIYSAEGQGGVDDETAGIHFAEWDGSTDNGYTTTARIIVDDSLVNDRWSQMDQIDTGDLDGDGNNELVVNNNGAGGAYDRAYILSIDGTFETGFYSMVTEGMWSKTTDEIGGSVAGATWGDTDGDGNMEGIFSVWNMAALFIVEATGANTYEYQNYLQLDYTGDGVPLDGVKAVDIDGDGKDEVYVPIYGGAELAVLDVEGDDISAATVETDVAYPRGTYGAGWGGIDAADYDANGVPELYNAQYFDYVYQIIFDGTNVKSMDAYSVTAAEKNMLTGGENGSYAVSAPGDLDGDGYGEVYVGHLALTEGNQFLQVHEYNQQLTKLDEKWRVITPNDYKLAQNYPNPFNPSTNIQFTLPLEKEVTLAVYDLMGHKVKTLVSEVRGEGVHTVTWNGTNAQGQQVASGVYIYRLEAGSVVKTRKMSLVR